MQRHIEIRFDKHDTLDRLRQRIHQKTGTSPGFQHLQIKSAGEVILEIPPTVEDHYKLGYFGLEHHGLEVHCVDLNPHSGSKGGQYEDVSLVEKYRMSEEEYNARKGTLRDWEREQKAKDSNFSLAKHAKEHGEMVEARRQHKLGLPLPPGFFVDSNGTVVRDEEYDSVVRRTTTTPSDATADDDGEYGEDSVAGMKPGDRCQVEPGARRGSVSYVGKVPDLGGGYWIGVTFDEPVGKTDGTTSSGTRYFDAMEKYGGFVRGKNVLVGDFPERDILDEDSDEDEV
jgi:tubulin-folding cofactor B